METLLKLTLTGSITVVIVAGLDRCLAAKMSARSRRLWWCFVPLAFLLPFRVPFWPMSAHVSVVPTLWGDALARETARISTITTPNAGHVSVAIGLWLVGAIGYVALVTIQTVRASRRWLRERLCTDPSLLALLEDCKNEAGVTAPIGLVISDSVSTPAILGWLRPRILLPTTFVTTDPFSKLRPILLHELAHFRWLDVPFNWLLTLTRAIHWFNPLAHLGAIAWTRFREEAADEAAVKWLRDDSGQIYGDALVQLLRNTQDIATPCGALAILESIHHLRRRIALITHFPKKSPRIALTCAVSLFLGMSVFSKSANAVENSTEKAALTAAQIWLKEIDGGEYANGWRDASPKVQTYLDASKWLDGLNKVRAPLGKCNQRQQIALIVERDPQWSPQGVIKGEFVVVEFKSSFENRAYASETLIVSKESDGPWKVFDYYIHPL